MESSARAQRADGQSRDNRVIRAFTQFSPSQEPSVRKLIASFPWEPNFELHLKYFPKDTSTECPRGDEIRTRKLQYIVESFNQVGEGQFVFHLDSDIVFLQPVYDDLLRRIDESGSGILFLDDAGKFGLGCFLARKTAGTERLFASAVEKLSDSYEDRCPINALLPESGVMAGRLPVGYQARGTPGNLGGIEPTPLAEVFTLFGNAPGAVDARPDSLASNEQQKSDSSLVPA
jgi:hypothetical protein